jgi:sugar lactone lactonase YvrE
MRNKLLLGALLPALFAVAVIGLPGAPSAEGMKVISDKTVTGFKFPESVAYDPAGQVLYVSEFGSELKPTEKDGQGRISKVSLDGKVLEERFLPAAGQTLNKPKGIWVAGSRLWVTDIDSLWVFDTGTREGRRIELPGIQFANDPTIVGGAVFVSDNRGDQLYRVTPADFLAAGVEPEVVAVAGGKAINPNGLYPGADGSLLMVGFKSDTEARGIYTMMPGGEAKSLAEGIGRLDGIYQAKSGDLLVTDWDSGSLNLWSEKAGLQKLAADFGGPADFTVVPNDAGILVVVPDLVKSELRLIQLSE